jgi:lysophospholipase L1-like esterase
VHSSLGGNAVRIRLTNLYGERALVIGAARVAHRASGSSIVAATDHALTFGGREAVSIPRGAAALSDPVSLDVPADSDLAVSLYLPEACPTPTAHWMALQTNYSVADQNCARDAQMPANTTTLESWPFLCGVDVRTTRQAGVVVALGDSITDGAASRPDTNGRWPDVLAARLRARHSGRPLAVVDAGISGNRILHDTGPQFGRAFGPSAMERFDRDVMDQPGVRYVIVLEGINDLGHPGSAAPESDEVSADDIIAGLKQLIERAHERGVKIFGGTMTPFESTTIARYYAPEREVKRNKVNEWIRTGGAFDGVIDFDKAVRDPRHTARFLPVYDSGDHLHPSAAGCRKMGEAIDLTLFH